MADKWYMTSAFMHQITWRSVHWAINWAILHNNPVNLVISNSRNDWEFKSYLVIHLPSGSMSLTSSTSFYSFPPNQTRIVQTRSRTTARKARLTSEPNKPPASLHTLIVKFPLVFSSFFLTNSTPNLILFYYTPMAFHFNWIADGTWAERNGQNKDVGVPRWAC